MNSVVCILGMHRSGTSCLAGCLEERGLELGDVVNAAPYNRKGNKENNFLRALNDAVLAYSGGSWDRPPVSLKWSDELRRYRDNYVASNATRKIWGFKDPRTLLTMPFWLEAGLHMRFVGTFRHPREVRRSLLQRPGYVPATPPLELWRQYNLKLVEFAAGHDVPLVSFDWPSARYESAIGQLATNLGLPNDSASPSFFEEQLRHNGGSQSEAFEVGPDYMALYERLVAMSLPAP